MVGWVLGRKEGEGSTGRGSGVEMDVGRWICG